MEIFEIRSRPSKTFEKCSLSELRTRMGEQLGARGRFLHAELAVWGGMGHGRKVRDGCAGTPLS